jgi:hypothetical protein
MNINAVAAYDDEDVGRGKRDVTANNFLVIILLLFSQTFISYLRSSKRKPLNRLGSRYTCPITHSEASSYMSLLSDRAK